MIRSEESTLARRQNAAEQPSQGTLTARWQSALQGLRAAREEYRALRSAAPVDVHALRKAAQRADDLEQLCWVLAREVGEPREG
jgi:hypothetical protein